MGFSFLVVFEISLVVGFYYFHKSFGRMQFLKKEKHFGTSTLKNTSRQNKIEFYAMIFVARLKNDKLIK